MNIIFLVSNLRKLALTFILTFITCLTFLLIFSYSSKAQTRPSIELSGYAWNHSRITISIIPQENEPWWKPYYLNATLRAIAQWNEAIQQFSANYTEFSYTSEIHLVPKVTQENVSGFDIYIGWIKQCESESTIGETRVRIGSPCIILNSTTCLAAKAPSGHIITEVDMQNIVVHELGHNFGLSHSNSSEDVMYSIVNYIETVKPVSTLDLYGVSKVFDWMSTSMKSLSPEMCPKESLLILSSTIPYLFFQISAENLPVYTPESLIEKTIGFFLRPEILTAFLIAMVLILAGMIVIIKRKKSNSKVR